VANELRGRPRLNIETSAILEAVRRHGHLMAATRELGCSDAYIHVRFKKEGLTLTGVLDGRNPETSQCHSQIRLKVWLLR